MRVQVFYLRRGDQLVDLALGVDRVSMLFMSMMQSRWVIRIRSTRTLDKKATVVSLVRGWIVEVS